MRNYLAGANLSKDRFAQKFPPENSMLAGINQNITRKGETYHIQTEDGGVRNPVITTVLFKGGRVIATRKVSYADILKFERLNAVVKEIMAEQHNALIKELMEGRFDSGVESRPDKPAESPGAEGKALPSAPAEDKKEGNLPPHEEKSLDEIILENLSLDAKE